MDFQETVINFKEIPCRKQAGVGHSLLTPSLNNEYLFPASESLKVLGWWERLRKVQEKRVFILDVESVCQSQEDIGGDI